MIFGSRYDSRRVGAGLCDRETVQAAKLRTMVPAMEVVHSGSPNGARRECWLGRRERVCAPNTRYKKLERKTNPRYMGEQDVGAE